MNVIEILDASGHLTLSWNPEDEASVSRAKEEFDRLKHCGYAFFATPASAQPIKRVKAAAFAQAGSLDVRPEQTKEFQPRAARTVAVRPMRGG